MKKHRRLLIIIAVIILIAAGLLIYDAINENVCKSRVYEDMQTELESVMSANIGIIPVTNIGGDMSFDGGGSGVIFQKENGTYYALTAAHVLTGDDAQYKVYTVNTDADYIDSDELGGAGELINIHEAEFYESLFDAKVEYVSSTEDIAIISFECSEELAVIQIAETVPEKASRIACVGNPEQNTFAVTYGEVKSNVKNRNGETLMQHNAYIYFGNSGGAVFNESMQLVGVNVGGILDILHQFARGEMVPCTQLSQCISEWKSA